MPPKACRTIQTRQLFTEPRKGRITISLKVIEQESVRKHPISHLYGLQVMVCWVLTHVAQAHEIPHLLEGPWRWARHYSVENAPIHVGGSFFFGGFST
jgi:hypothetical protein